MQRFVKLWFEIFYLECASLRQLQQICDLSTVNVSSFLFLNWNINGERLMERLFWLTCQLSNWPSHQGGAKMCFLQASIFFWFFVNSKLFQEFCKIKTFAILTISIQQKNVQIFVRKYFLMCILKDWTA